MEQKYREMVEEVIKRKRSECSKLARDGHREHGRGTLMIEFVGVPGGFDVIMKGYISFKELLKLNLPDHAFYELMRTYDPEREGVMSYLVEDKSANGGSMTFDLKVKKRRRR